MQINILFFIAWIYVTGLVWDFYKQGPRILCAENVIPEIFYNEIIIFFLIYYRL
jgi:hypothetical protein